MKKHILLIEDDELLRENIALILESEGYRTSKAVNGTDAVREIRKRKFDMILCDIMIPGLDGYGVLKTIKELNKKHTAPFIFITAKTERTDMRKGMELGADDYLTKPFTREEILNSINAQFSKRETLMEEQKEEEVLLKEIRNRIQSKAFSGQDDTRVLKYEENIFLADRGKSEFVKISSIPYLSAAKDYTIVHTSDNRSFAIRKPLKAWESRLPGEYFLRIHRSTIINTEYIEKVEKWFNYSHKLFLKNVKDPFIISQRYSRKLRKKITKL